MRQSGLREPETPQAPDAPGELRGAQGESRVKYLAIRNWESFQHYKDRDPTWIKVYGRLLDDAEFLALPEAAQAQLIKLWLIASRCRNRITNSKAFLQHSLHCRRLYINELLEAGFLEPADQIEERTEKWASRYVAPDVRARVMATTGGKCAMCGSTDNIEIDHIIPISKGGTGDEVNLQPLCRPCNRRKRTSAEPIATQVGTDAEQVGIPHARPRARGEAETEAETETTPPTGAGRELFLSTMSASQRTGWTATLSGWVQGMGAPGGKPFTEEQIDTGLAEYMATVATPDFSPRHVVRFVEGVANRKANTPGPRRTGSFLDLLKPGDKDAVA
jgi:hypothetical protein